ncbi:MAG: sulfotransferase family 2 domain-containing protein [Deltaproteobacteria bacterium]|nr:sulfotransferase family 2 domain-containing protein [Deltaproteobacteria bacterium]MBW2172754.1 sulfotransferase family 2 domain-containing protein [Deltaproteobacteria bacterium]
MRTIPGEKSELDSRSRVSQRLLEILNYVRFIPSSRCYNLTISHERKFVWFRVAKVGTRTIFDHMKESGVRLDLEHPYRVYYPPKLYEDYFKFAFVRNPWDRLVSCWHNKVLRINHFKFDDVELARMRKFEHFVDYVSRLDIENCNNHLRLQCTLIDLDHVDYLGRFETFSDDLRFVFQQLDMPSARLPHKNKSSRQKDYREYYSDGLRERVYQIYRKDMQIFGYQYE